MKVTLFSKKPPQFSANSNWSAFSRANLSGFFPGKPSSHPHKYHFELFFLEVDIL